MKTKNLNPIDNYLAGSWEALGNGAPVLVALAQMCSHTWTRSGRTESSSATQSMSTTDSITTDAMTADVMTTVAEEAGGTGLTGEALAILFAAKDRGIIELKAVNTAFDAAARLLAVYVEESNERTIAFRDSQKPEITVRFLDGFRQLCERGLIIHHIYRDFSLSPRGFELAGSIERSSVQRWLDMATEFGLHD